MVNLEPKIKLVVFDMAGTTVRDENEVHLCFMEAAERSHLPADPQKVNSMMGWSKLQVFQTLWAEHLGADHPDYGDRVSSSFAEFKTILEDHYQTSPVMPTEGCMELFYWLKNHQIKIALTTGFYREVTNIILQKLLWHGGLDDNYLGDETSIINFSVTPSEIYQEEGRPAPFMIQKAMDRLGIRDSQKVVNIGDTPSDLASGFRANCLFSFGVTNGSHTQKELSQYPCDRLFSSLKEFQQTLETLI